MSSFEKLYIKPVNEGTARRVTNVFLWLVTGAQLGLFVASLFKSSWVLTSLEDNPLVGPGKDVLLSLGATATYKIRGSHEWWRIVSSPFLPAGTLHLWAIASALWTFGLFLGNTLAPWQLVLVFATSSLAGVTVSANVANNYVTSAASGPIFGLIGGTCMALLLYWQLFRYHFISLAVLALVLALNLYMGATPFVDQACNIAGFVAGSLSTTSMLLLNKQGAGTRRRELHLQLLAFLLLGVSIAISVLAIIGLNVSKSPIAGCCDKLLCTPSELWDCDAAKVRLDCSYLLYQNGTVVIGCPKGYTGSVNVPRDTPDSVMVSLCDSTCGIPQLA